MTPVAEPLAAWAAGLEPSDDDLALARRSLVDTVAVAIAARAHPIGDLLGELLGGRGVGRARARPRLRRPAHGVDVARQRGVRARGAGGRRRRARLPRRRRRHGPPGQRAGLAALRGGLARDLHGRALRPRRPGAAVALGLGADEVATAMALAVPAAGGVQRAFGTAAKALQVGAAAQAGVRAARLAGRRRVGRSARARPVARAGGRRRGAARARRPRGPRRAGRQALPLLLRAAAPDRGAARARRRRSRRRSRAWWCARRESALAPLIHAAPTTGLEGKFSLQYAVAATLLDGRPGIESFTDDAVARPAAQALLAPRRGRRHARRRLAAGRRRGDRAHARRRLDAARAARPPARRARPSAVDRPSWPRRSPTAPATWPTRSSRSTGLDAGRRSCASGCRRRTRALSAPAGRPSSAPGRHPLRQPRIAHDQARRRRARARP